MNTKNKQEEKNQRQKTGQEKGPKRDNQRSSMLHDTVKQQDHENPETRMTR